MSLLDGRRAIDAASFIAGPVAATIPADLGAGCAEAEVGTWLAAGALVQAATSGPRG